ncbi:MAG: hypothetical protein WBF99_18340 [Xanthobacteraceae bacterium]
MSSTGDAMRRLRRSWKSLEADDQILVFVHFASIAIMAVAIALQFGWNGAAFVFGAIFWKASGKALGIPSPPSKEGE